MALAYRNPARRDPLRPRRRLTEPAQRRAEAAIADLGERITAARSPLTVLLDAEQPLSRVEIEATLARNNVRMDRVTLYHVLDWLVSRNLAHMIEGHAVVARPCPDRPRRHRCGGELHLHRSGGPGASPAGTPPAHGFCDAVRAARGRRGDGDLRIRLRKDIHESSRR
jgi:hypothetical protein